MTTSLVLNVLRYKGNPPPAELSCEFGPEGGSLGRSSKDNRFVLPDPENTVSRWHGKIGYQNGIYEYTDTSSGNGTDLVNRGRWLKPGETIDLAHGDVLRIGEYELEVILPEKPPRTVSPVWDPSSPEWPPFIPEWEPPFPPAPRWTEPAGGKPETPPEPKARPAPAFPPAETHGQAPPPRAETDLLRSFLAGAGLDGFDDSTDADLSVLMETAGKLFRCCVDGLMGALQARDQIKKEFNISRTNLRGENNNLLKVAANLDENLKAMLKPSQPGFKDPVTSVQDGFTDLMSHQMAMNAGWQAVLSATLERFDPQLFEKQCEEGAFFQKKAKCWDLYSKAYPELVERIWETLFTEEFAEGYEQQMRKLQSTRP